ALAEGEDSPVRGRVGVAPVRPALRQGGHASGLGGQQLAVSRYSRHPEVAADLVFYLTSPQEQKRRAVEAGFNPTIPALYRDPDVARKVPFIAELHEVLVAAVARPSAATGRAYNRVSATFFDAVHRVLSGRAEPGAALTRLEQDLRRARRRGWSR
ncbi:MAG TPA: ABC transporter substrate-binding protein, partial [Beijerinckiaceae bacterium]|nr:ABC transporter substrate-binding protein [Beijerinckiaceae bacterium]